MHPFTARRDDPFTAGQHQIAVIAAEEELDWSGGFTMKCTSQKKKLPCAQCRK
jgi:hypothetical protein